MTSVPRTSCEATRIAVAATPIVCPHSGPCKSSPNARCFLYSWEQRPSHTGTTKVSGWSGKFRPASASVALDVQTGARLRWNFGPICKCPCLVDSNATTFVFQLIRRPKYKAPSHPPPNENDAARSSLTVYHIHVDESLSYRLLFKLHFVKSENILNFLWPFKTISESRFFGTNLRE